MIGGRAGEIAVTVTASNRRSVTLFRPQVSARGGRL